MKLDDIIALAKQGYKPSDIKELVALSSESEEDPEPKAPAEGPDKTPEDQEKEPDKQPKKEEEPPALDYKKLYEEQKAQVDALQKANRDRDISGGKKEESAYDILSQIL